MTTSAPGRGVPSFLILGIVIFTGGCLVAFGGSGARGAVLVIGVDAVALVIFAALDARTALGRVPVVTKAGGLVLLAVIPILAVSIGCYVDTHSWLWTVVAGFAALLALWVGASLIARRLDAAREH